MNRLLCLLLCILVHNLTLEISVNERDASDKCADGIDTVDETGNATNPAGDQAKYAFFEALARYDNDRARKVFFTAMNFHDTPEEIAILDDWIRDVVDSVHQVPIIWSSKTLPNHLLDLMFEELQEVANYTIEGVRANEVRADARSRDFQCERIKQNTPMNVVDGMWANTFVPDAIPEEYVTIIDKIRFEEQGEGDLHKNHPYMWAQTAASVGYTFPPVSSIDFAYFIGFADKSFWNAALTAAVGRVQGWIPEKLGMIAFLEMRSSAPCHKQIQRMKVYGLDFSYYQVHRSIDNPHTGHAAQILKAIELYLQYFPDVHDQQEQSRRVMKGYHAFEFTIDAIDLAVEEHMPAACPNNGPSRTRHHPESSISNITAQMEKFIEKFAFAHTFHKGAISEHLKNPSSMIQHLLNERCDLFSSSRADNTRFMQLFKHGGPMYGVDSSDMDSIVLRDFARMASKKCSEKYKAKGAPGETETN